MSDLIAYRRVSTKGQVDKYGLPAQETDMRDYAKTAHHHIIRIETDGGLTGILPADERPALLACLKAIRDGEAKGLLLPSLNRLARELTVQEAILAQVWKMGGEVYTAEQGKIEQDDPDDPMKTAMRQMVGVFAQLDRALVIKKLRNGRSEKAKVGGYAYGAPAYGQMAVDKELAPNEQELQVISHIRSMRDDGKSFREIAKYLNDQRIPTKHGKTWYPQTVANIVNR
jgi:DNA invertase Pin-like site-specific DNA recombinase